MGHLLQSPHGGGSVGSQKLSQCQLHFCSLNNLPPDPPLQFPYTLNCPNLSNSGTAPHGKDMLLAQLVYQQALLAQGAKGQPCLLGGQKPVGTLRCTPMGNRVTKVVRVRAEEYCELQLQGLKLWPRQGSRSLAWVSNSVFPS